MAALLRFLTVVAVLMMPFGMTAAAAVAAPSPGHHMATSMPHCPDEAPTQQSKGGIAECTMACSAALPAIGSPADRVPLLICAPSEEAAARILEGLHPDPVTPPPKRS